MNIELNGIIKFYYRGCEVIGKVIGICADKITIKAPNHIYNLPKSVIEQGEVKPVYVDEAPLKQAKIVRKRAEEPIRRNKPIKKEISLTGFNALKKDKQGEL